MRSAREPASNLDLRARRVAPVEDVREETFSRRGDARGRESSSEALRIRYVGRFAFAADGLPSEYLQRE